MFLCGVQIWANPNVSIYDECVQIENVVNEDFKISTNDDPFGGSWVAITILGLNVLSSESPRSALGVSMEEPAFRPIFLNMWHSIRHPILDRNLSKLDLACSK